MVSVVTGEDPWVELLDAGRVEEARGARGRRRWLEAAAAESATMAGVLLDLADRRELVSVGIAGGGLVLGEIAGVGADVVVLDKGQGSWVLVPLRAVAEVRPHDGAAPIGDREPPEGPSLVDLLARTGERQEQVVVHLSDGSSVAGVVDAAGDEVVRVRSEDPTLGVTYVSPASIREVAVFRSG
jgi:hypothetical protein